MPKIAEHFEAEIEIPAGNHRLGGELLIPANSLGVVLFAHGSGSSRHSPRNQFVARFLRERGIGTCLFDLLTEAEEQEDRFTGHLRFDIGLLADRLGQATQWLHQKDRDLRFGYFGASTGGGAALVAAANSEIPIHAVVSRGGRPDLAEDALPKVEAPTLLIVGERDTEVIRLNQQALTELQCVKRLELVPRATHLFEEPGTLEKAADLAAEWFQLHLKP